MYTIAKAKEAVKKGIRGYLLKDHTGSYVMKEVNRLPFYLEGAPGIGKTEIVHQIAEELGIGYVSFSLVHHTRNSLLGLPIIKELEDGDKYTCYTISEIIAKVMEQKENGYQEGILLLDEFPCMSETILPAMLSFLQTKNIGTHRLPEGWVIVLCGNPPEYNKTARTFDVAIMDRIRTLKVEFQPEVFLEYASSAGIHPAILEYLDIHRQHVYRCKTEKKSQELVTCRGWENISHMLKTYEALEQEVDREAICQFIKSEEVSAEFCQFYEQYCMGFSNKCAEDIFHGVNMEYYVKLYQSLSFDRKWRILDYMTDYLTENHKASFAELEIWRETERMMAELHILQNALDQEEADEGINLADYIAMPASTVILKLKNDSRFSWETDLRKKIMNEWYDYALEQDKKGTKLLKEGSIFEKCIRALKEWQREMIKNLSTERLKSVSEKMERILEFTEQIDQEKSLLEMLFRKINASELLLIIMSVQPNELYLEMCAKRYAV